MYTLPVDASAPVAFAAVWLSHKDFRYCLKQARKQDAKMKAPVMVRAVMDTTLFDDSGAYIMDQIPLPLS